jgi:hypothetical protein
VAKSGASRARVVKNIRRILPRKSGGFCNKPGPARQEVRDMVRFYLVLDRTPTTPRHPETLFVSRVRASTLV